MNREEIKKNVPVRLYTADIAGTAYANGFGEGFVSGGEWMQQVLFKRIEDVLFHMDGSEDGQFIKKSPFGGMYIDFSEVSKFLLGILSDEKTYNEYIGITTHADFIDLLSKCEDKLKKDDFVNEEENKS